MQGIKTLTFILSGENQNYNIIFFLLKEFINGPVFVIFAVQTKRL